MRLALSLSQQVEIRLSRFRNDSHFLIWLMISFVFVVFNEQFMYDDRSRYNVDNI